MPNEGFGLSCLHCHASAERELTFAALDNITGFPGNPLSYFVDRHLAHAAAVRAGDW